jgi:hypothetical protein
LVGQYFTLLIIMSRGWPFTVFMWSLYDFGMLYGDRPFSKHWGYRQSAIELFNETNPSGNDVANVWNRRVLFIALFVSLASAFPHNWVMRILKENKVGKEEFDYDKQIRKKRKERSNQQHGHAPFFSSFAPDNRLVRDDQLDTSKFMEVAVPVTPLYFRRFYDWPPEPEYARVAKCNPPKNDPVAEQLLEDDDFELYDGDCEYEDESTALEKGTWGSRAMGIAKKVKPTLRHRKRLPDVDEMTSTTS